jgi:transposase
MLYIGVDLHRKVSQVAVLDAAGEQVLNRRVRTSPDQLTRVFGELAPEPIEVAFEATFGWGWFADLLLEAGIPAHMVHPRAAKAISTARVKNDAVDAKTLAQLLRSNMLPEAWIAPPEVREARRLARMRTSLIRIRSRLKCQVHALLAEHGITLEVSDSFGKQGRELLDGLQLPLTSQNRVAANLRLVDGITEEVKLADQELKALFAKDTRLQRLTAIPGIGFTTAAVILAEVGTISRFASPDRLCSWAGLTPTEHSSAEHTRRGHISKQGSRWLRWVLVEAACHAVRDLELRRFYQRIADRRQAKIARVAVARRLLTLCFYALRDQHGCRAYPVAP